MMTYRSESVIPNVPPWRATGGDREPAERLADLAAAIGRLAPDWRQPERYYERRSELAEEARRLARAMDSG